MTPASPAGPLLRICGPALVWAAICAQPAPAAEFQPPDGCTLQMTVQARGCTVGQHYTCQGDNPGDMRTTYFDTEGPRHISLIDRETRWLETMNPRNGIVDSLEAGAADDASFSTLIQTGRDDFDFWTRSENGIRLRHMGYDELTGRQVVIDGQQMEETRFELTTTDDRGEVLWRRTGNQFVSREFGRFFGGVEHSSDWTGLDETSNDSPVTFDFPGDPGFGETTPQYDCSMQMVNFRPGTALLPAALRRQ